MSLFDDLEGPPEPPAVWTVGALIKDVKEQLERVYPEVTVKGEISSFKSSGPGHMYFDLKDAEEDAKLSCVFFKFQQRGLRFEPKDGMEVEAYGVFDLYAPRGSFQLRVLGLRPAGIGALLLRFEALRKKLAAEGLFDASRKRAIPAYPRTVGLVTSPSGAAIHDLLHVLRRRWPGLRIVLAPVLVQGPGAAEDIARAIERFGRHGEVDVLIVGRGGGSLEDLWAFNEEVVVRAIAASRIPVVSAVGHESDTTLADFAADVRAATPSAAAELVTTPDRAHVRRTVRDLLERSEECLLDQLETGRDRLAALRRTYGFRRPADLIATFAQGVDDRRLRLVRALKACLSDTRGTLRVLAARVDPRRLRERLADMERQETRLSQRLTRFDAVTTRTQRVTAARARLEALSPRAVLARGYSLVTLEGGAVVRSTAQLSPGEKVAIEFAQGRAGARVESVEG